MSYIDSYEKAASIATDMANKLNELVKSKPNIPRKELEAAIVNDIMALDCICFSPGEGGIRIIVNGWVDSSIHWDPRSNSYYGMYEP